MGVRTGWLGLALTAVELRAVRRVEQRQRRSRTGRSGRSVGPSDAASSAHNVLVRALRTDFGSARVAAMFGRAKGGGLGGSRWI